MLELNQIIASIIIGAFILIITSAWNDLMVRLFRSGRLFNHPLASSVAYAIFITLVGVYVIFLITSRQKALNRISQQELQQFSLEKF